jgi:hypothetical protein
VIFVDESGLLMAPLVRRTWAPRGQTPTLRQRGKHREKVSIAGALWWAPRRRRQLGFVFRTLVDAYYDNERSAAFLEILMREIPERIIVIWDGGMMHKGDPHPQGRRALQAEAAAGEVAPVRADAQPGRAVVELAEARPPVQRRPRGRRGTQSQRRARVDAHHR